MTTPLAANDAPRTRAYALALVALVVLPTIVLWPYRHAAFVSDDIFFGYMYKLTSWTGLFTDPWPHSLGRTSAWRPVVLLSYLFSAATLHGGPESYRLFNYFLHGVASALLASVVAVVSGRRLAGLVAGLLFAVHPIVHESVLWISGRTYPLSAVFGLALCRWTMGAATRRQWLQHLVGVLLLAAALASYEFAVVLPLVLGMLLLIDRQRQWSMRAAAWFLLPYVATLFLYLAFRWLWITDFNADLVVAARASQWAPAVGQIGERLMRNALFFTLRLLAWPWFDRGSDITVSATALLTTAVVASAVVYLVRSRDLCAAAAFWLCWGLIFFAPVAAYAGFSDRFGYLSVAAVAALVGTATGAIANGEKRRRLPIWLGAVALMAGLWTHALREHGRDWVEAGQVAEAVVAEALRHEPDPREPVDLHFVWMPVRHHSALVFLTYFPQALALHYSESASRNVTFHLEWEPVDGVVARLRSRATDRQVRVYEWLPGQRSLVLRWAGEALPAGSGSVSLPGDSGSAAAGAH